MSGHRHAEGRTARPESILVEDVPSEVPRPIHGWWSESIDDGGGHYGARQDDDTVIAACGRRFTPMQPGFGFPTRPHQEPADRQHACPACLREHPAAPNRLH